MWNKCLLILIHIYELKNSLQHCCNHYMQFDMDMPKAWMTLNRSDHSLSTQIHCSVYTLLDLDNFYLNVCKNLANETSSGKSETKWESLQIIKFPCKLLTKLCLGLNLRFDGNPSKIIKFPYKLLTKSNCFPCLIIYIPNYIKAKLQDLTTDNIHSAKKVPGHFLSSIFTKMLHIRQIKSLLYEAGECPLHLDTKLEGKRLINNRILTLWMETGTFLKVANGDRWADLYVDEW